VYGEGVARVLVVVLVGLAALSTVGAPASARAAVPAATPPAPAPAPATTTRKSPRKKKPKKAAPEVDVTVSAPVSPPPPPVVVAPPPPPPPSPAPPPPPPVDPYLGSSRDTAEDPTRRYYFVGLRYRGDVLPKFLLNAFVDGGKTIYSSSIGAELDLRKDGFSLIPAITYSEYSTGDVLFLQKNKPASDPGSWSLVNSSLKALYLSADLLWSVRLAPHWDFEYGAGFGLGAVFGSLETNWVYTPGSATFDPNRYQSCTSASQTAGENGCQVLNHSGSTAPGHINGYREPSWINGGSKPSLFPLIDFPQIGVRYQPIKQVESRLGAGFSLTGFWFGVSVDYGLEKPTR
jgi:hypothetical protein